MTEVTAHPTPRLTKDAYHILDLLHAGQHIHRANGFSGSDPWLADDVELPAASSLSIGILQKAGYIYLAACDHELEGEQAYHLVLYQDKEQP